MRAKTSNFTAFERFLYVFSPKIAKKRAEFRIWKGFKSGLKRKYEGASKSRRTKGWTTSGASANTEIFASLEMLRQRSRALVRDDAYAANAVTEIVGNTIGTGIVAKVRAKSKAKEKRVQELWDAWSKSINCDTERLHNFDGLQALAMRSMVEGGEVLIRRVRPSNIDRNPIPLRLQIIESDLIDTNKNEELAGGGRIHYGIEFNSQNERVAYWLFPSHPGDQRFVRTSFTSKRIPAEDILHLYRVDRAGQLRGVPWGAPVILSLRDLNEYEDFQLVRQKVAACFTAFYYEPTTPEDGPEEDGSTIDKLEPGLLERLPPGHDVKFANPPAVTGYSDHTSGVLHRIAKGWGVSYEALTGDYSKVNFSSGRMGHLSFHRNIESWRWNILVPRLHNEVWTWFTEAAAIMGVETAGCFPEWTAPRREMIDPNTEVLSLQRQVRSGFTSWSEAVRSLGYDPETNLEEIKSDFEKFDQAKIILDIDPRKTSQQGMAADPDSLAALTGQEITPPKDKSAAAKDPADDDENGAGQKTATDSE